MEGVSASHNPTQRQTDTQTGCDCECNWMSEKGLILIGIDRDMSEVSEGRAFFFLGGEFALSHNTPLLDRKIHRPIADCECNLYV